MSDVISIKGLEVHFRGCDALRGVDLSVSSGKVFALLGENGAGKTTLIRVMTGFLRQSAGECTVLGLNPAREAQEIRRRIGYVSDAPALYEWMRVDEIGWFASSFYSDGFLAQYRDAIDRFEVPASRKIRYLSKGQRAKVALALALAHDPELLILDEPTSGLDPLVRREFLESMLDRAATGRTIFLSSHQISEVERVADDIAILHQGKFSVIAPLNELRDAISEITVSMSDPLAALPDFEATTEVLSEQTEGRQRRFVVRGLVPELAKQWEQRPGVANVRVRHVTLDELFVACTRGARSLEENGKRKPSTIELKKHVG